MSIQLSRSILYCPGSNERALVKARTLAADGIVIDLEDAVVPDEKGRARDRVLAVARAGGFGPRTLAARINPLATPWGAQDLAVLAGAPLDAVVVPKVNRPEDIRAVEAALSAAGAPAGLKIWAMVETPEAVANVMALAAVAAEEGGRLAALLLGTNDLAHQLRVPPRPGRAALVTHLATAVLAARRYGLLILDGVFNGLDDPEGFAAECAQACDLGFDGKTLIHPGQIAACNDVFAPDPDAIDVARAIVAAFEDPTNAGKGAIRVRGRMVETMHALAAARTLELAAEIARRNKDPATYVI